MEDGFVLLQNTGHLRFLIVATEFKDDVESGVFPGEEYAPYKMTEDEEAIFEEMLRKDEEERRLQHEIAHKKLAEADEYEALNLYGDKGN